LDRVSVLVIDHLHYRVPTANDLWPSKSATPCSISRFIRRCFRFVVIAIASHAAPALHNRIVNVKTISTDILTLLEKPWCPACVFKNARRVPPQDGLKLIKSYFGSGKGLVGFVKMSYYL